MSRHPKLKIAPDTKSLLDEDNSLSIQEGDDHFQLFPDGLSNVKLSSATPVFIKPEKM
jgi:hypothetical protein